MMAPSKQKAHKALLTYSMVAEHAYLARVAPVFGRVAPEDYAQRSASYNAECKALGATLMMVVAA
jgi:hypothetical protein